MLAGTSALGTQVQSRVGKTGLGLLGVPGEYSAQDGDPGHGHKPPRRGLWVGVGRQRFPARGRVFGVGPGCLNQGLSLSLGWGALLDSS